MTTYFAEFAWIGGRIEREVRIEVTDGVFSAVNPRGTEPASRRRSVVNSGPGNSGDQTSTGPGNSGDQTSTGPGNSGDQTSTERGNSGDQAGNGPANSGRQASSGPNGISVTTTERSGGPDSSGEQPSNRAADGPGGVEMLPGLVLPGFANAHSHAFHRALRGRTHAGRGSFWSWRDRMYAIAASLDPDRYYRLARAVYAEMALAGITAVGEFHYLHHNPDGTPYADPNAMGNALIAAAEDAGIRITLLDTLYLQSGVDGRPLEGVQRRFDDKSPERWQERVAALTAAPHARIGAAIHSVRAVAAHHLGAANGHRPLHVHLSEQPAENEQCRAVHGCTPTELLDRYGVLGPNTTVVHATHLTDHDVKRLSGTGVCLCPTTERDLADGIGRARDLVDAGSPLSLGSDSHAVIDMFEEIRGTEMDERLATRQRGRFTTAELIGAATAHGSLGWADAGEIAPGRRADLVCVRLDSVRTAGCDPAEAVFAATAADVVRVIVGGRTIVADGRHEKIDVPRALAEAIR